MEREVVEILSDEDEPAPAKRAAPGPADPASRRKRFQVPTPVAAPVAAPASRQLMPGEEAAIANRTYKEWSLRPSRNFDEDSAEDRHWRICESQWLRMRGGDGGFRLRSARYVYNPELRARFDAKAAEYDRTYGSGRHTQLLGFHGTSSQNIDKIVREGFKIAKVGSTTDPGYFGAGMYFSEFANLSQGYCQGGTRMIIARLLLGKPFNMRGQMSHGCACKPGYTSHLAKADGSEVVIFDEAAMLPVYVIDFGAPQTTLTFRVAQISPDFGAGVLHEVTVDVKQP